MERIIVERVFDDPVRLEQFTEGANRFAWCFDEYNVSLVHTMVSPDGKRMICVYDARDAAAVRTVNRTAGAPFERIWKADVYVPVQTDQGFGLEKS